MSRNGNHVIRRGAAALLLLLAAADVSVAVGVSGSPNTRTVARGGSTTYTIAWTSTSFLEMTCTLSVVSAPPGLARSFSNATLQMGQTSILTVDTDAVAVGVHIIRVRALSNLGMTATRDFTLNVTDIGSFAISAVGPVPSIHQGTTGSITLLATPSGGFSSPISLSQPSTQGASFSFSGGNVIQPNGTKVMNVTISSNATLGLRTVTVQGVGGLVSRSASITINVVPPSFIFGTASTVVPAEWNDSRWIQVNTTPIGTIVDGVQLYVLTTIPNVSMTFDSNTMTTSGSRTLTMAVGLGAAFGVYDVQLRAIRGSTTRDLFFKLIIGLKPRGALAAPQATIPDNNASSPVVSSLSITTGVAISSIAVRVKVTHPYRGDLRIELTSPSGSVYTLKQTSGDSGDNVNTVYPTVTAPVTSLAGLIGQALTGTWTLRVWDLGPEDVGTLDEWSLTLNGEQTVSGTLAIPDNNTAGTQMARIFTGFGTVRQVRVRVNITHPYKGDLRVRLVAPSGAIVNLHDRTGGSADNIVTLYPDLTAPATPLDAFANASIGGIWKVTVVDLAGGNAGTLNSVTISIEPN